MHPSQGRMYATLYLAATLSIESPQTVYDMKGYKTERKWRDIMWLSATMISTFIGVGDGAVE